MRKTPTLHVVCDNPECYWVGQIRHVPFTYIRQGVYARPNGFKCECGWDCRETVVGKDPVEPPPEMLAREYEWAVMEPPC